MLAESDFKPPQAGLPTRWLLDFVIERGLTAAEITAELGIDSDILASREAVLDLTPYNTLFEWAAQRLGDPDLGLHVGESLGAHQLGIYGYLISNAHTLRDWAGFVENYHAVFSRDFRIEFFPAETGIRCQYDAPFPDPDAARQDIDFTMVALVRFIQGQLEERWWPANCSFSYHQPSSTLEHQRLFGESLQFAQKVCGFEIEDAVLDTPISGADPNLLLILQQQVQPLLEQLQEKVDLLSQVKLLITATLGEKKPGMGLIARQLNLSERSLNRQLAERGTNFRKLREVTVMQIAREALASTDASITDIALRLGYSETSAFVRAFSKAEGCSPLKFRRREVGPA